LDAGVAADPELAEHACTFVDVERAHERLLVRRRGRLDDRGRPRSACARPGRPPSYSEDRARPPGSEVERLLAGTSKAQRLLDWSPEFTLEEGLKRTIEWFEGSLHAYKPSIYNV
jgi:hypothetical protein